MRKQIETITCDYCKSEIKEDSKSHIIIENNVYEGGMSIHLVNGVSFGIYAADFCSFDCFCNYMRSKLFPPQQN